MTELTARLTQHADETGQILFDGEWLPIAEAEQEYRRLERDGKVKIAEMIFIFTLIFIAANMPFIVLAALGGIAG